MTGKKTGWLQRAKGKCYFRIQAITMRLPIILLIVTMISSCQEEGSRYQQSAIEKESAPTPVEKEKEAAVVYKQVDDYTACLFSQLSYCAKPDSLLKAHLPGWQVIWYPKPIGGNHAFVATDGNSYVIAVRGSLMEVSWDAFDNWIYQDMNIVEQVKWPYAYEKKVRIAGGAHRGWKNLEQLTDTATGEKLAAFLQKSIHEKSPVIFTGHSLGGNLATVYLSYFSHLLEKSSRKANLQLITFAAPAPGNEAFAKDIQARFPASYRIENELDIVPKFPCTGKVAALGTIYKNPAASEIMVGYRQATVSLSNVFRTVSAAISLLEMKNGLSSFAAIENKHDKLLPAIPSGNNTQNSITDWFAEAAHQHSIRQYATLLKVPVLDCAPQ